MVLPDDYALIFHRNLPVIPARLLKYYNAPEFRDGGTGIQPGLKRKADRTLIVLLAAFLVMTVLAVIRTIAHERVSSPSPRIEHRRLERGSRTPGRALSRRSGLIKSGGIGLTG